MKSIPSFNEPRNGKTPRICVIKINSTELTRYLFVEEEICYKNEILGIDINDPSIYNATMYRIILYFKDITPNLSSINNEVLQYSAHYDKSKNEVSLINGVITMGTMPKGLKGKHISTYMLSRIVQWAKENFENAEVEQIFLIEGDASQDNKNRRNRLYEQIGYKFDFDDTEFKVGKSRKMSVQNLNYVNTWKNNIKELNVDTFVFGMLYDLDVKNNKYRIKSVFLEIFKIVIFIIIVFIIMRTFSYPNKTF